MSDPYKEAAAKYYLALEDCRRCRVLVEAVDDMDEKAGAQLRKALGAGLRSKFRGISAQLTKRVGFAYSSVAARELISDFDIDHAVPLAMVHLEITLQPNLDAIEALIRKHVVGVKLTRQEHRDLNREFKQTMPHMWNWGDDILARYKAIGLEVA